MKSASSNNSLLPPEVLKTENHTQALTHATQKSESEAFFFLKMCLGHLAKEVQVS